MEWYYSEKRETQPLNYYRALQAADRIKVLKLFKAIGDTGRMTDESKFRNEGDKIFAFKPQPHRFLSFFVKGRKIIVTNAFWKKQVKLPPQEKERALSCMKSYVQRVTDNNYYEKD